jgi:Zn-finger in ubiquitin-hydrolases and other protein
MAKSCSHIDHTSSVAPRTAGCEECLQMGRDWLHLRLCLTCGHVGCCDDSAGKHATAHFQSTGHEVVKSLEEGENWYWCFMDNVLIQFENEGSESTVYSDSNSEMTTSSVLLPFNSTDGNTARSSLPIMGTSSVSNRTRGMFKSICQRVRRCNKQKLEPTIELAVGNAIHVW